jgi:hypothetical protein
MGVVFDGSPGKKKNCFTGTKVKILVHILTQTWGVVFDGSPGKKKNTCFTGAQVQILVQKYKYSPSPTHSALLLALLLASPTLGASS